MTVRRQILLFLALLAIWLAGGCRGGDSQPVAAEIDEPYYRQGQQLVKQGRTQEALASFLKVIEKRGDQASAESHLEAGLIYLNHSKDPVEAYHHFRQYLAQQPNARQAPNVRELVDTAKRNFAATLPGQPLENQAAHMDLIDQVGKLQRENEKLQAELAAIRSGANASVLTTTRAPANNEAPLVHVVVPPPPVIAVEEESPITPAPAPSRPPPNAAPTAGANAPRNNAPAPRTPAVRPGASAGTTVSGRRHVVAQGDTLFGLTKKYYGAGSTAKAKAIFEANRDVMKDEGDLKPGMELRIP